LSQQKCRSMIRRFNKILFLIFCFKVLGTLGQEEAEEEYIYDEDDSIESKGTRIVGASLGDTKEVPFLVGYNIEGIRHISTCTGSLITRQFVLSAAHCLDNIVTTELLSKCVQMTKRGKSLLTPSRPSHRLTCERYVDGSTKINLLHPKGAAYVGVNNISQFNPYGQGEMIQIDYVAYHAKSYKGGGNYGSYGGYDIALLHLERPVSKKFEPACLPGPNFKDNGIGSGYNSSTTIRIAGYGKYFRKNCMTDDYGPSKHHYCAGKCKTTIPPINKECRAFFNNPRTPKKVPDGDTDLIILKKTKAVHCYNNVSALHDSHGWCRIDRDASRIGSIRDLKPETQSWGFCSRDCYLNKGLASAANFLRKKYNVDILDDRLCQRYLKTSFWDGPVKVYPKILCIGNLKKLKYSVWIKNGANNYKQIPRGSYRHKLELLKGSNIYVHAAGTCNGDSGGPVFIKNQFDNKYVVLGTVSGGRGLGDCGGMNNPSHYVRVSAFRRWFQIILGKEMKEVCFSDGKRAKYL